MADKSFFAEKSIREIRELYPKEISINFIDEIDFINKNESVLIDRDIISSSSKSFKKHYTPFTIVSDFESILNSEIIPERIIKSEFDKIDFKNPFFSGYKIIIPNFSETPRIPLVDLIEGVKIFAYSGIIEESVIAQSNYFNKNDIKPFIDIKAYDDSDQAKTLGSHLVLNIPSRSKNHARHEVSVHGIPLEDNISQWSLAYSLKTNHTCKRKTYNLGYPKNLDDVNVSEIWCAHDIAAIIASEFFYKKSGKTIPFKQNIVAIPSQRMVDFYSKLCNNSLLKSEQSVRKLNDGEKEVFLWAFVGKFGYDEAFKPGRVREYNW